MRAVRFFALPVLSMVFVTISHLVQAQDLAPSPVPPPSSDGTAIDQGIAYFLLLVALAITYTFH